MTSLSTLISAWADKCTQLEKCPSEFLRSVDLSSYPSDVQDDLRWMGAVSCVNDELHKRRQRSPEPRQHSRGVAHSLHGRNPDPKWGKLEMVMQGEDSALKPLLHFTEPDLTYLLLGFTAQKSAFQRRINWTKSALSYLNNHGAAIIAELPEAALAALNAQAELAWELR